MQKRQLMSMVVLLIGIIFSALCYSVIVEGSCHVDPATELRLATMKWEEEHTVSALIGIVRANLMAFECGLRWNIAGDHINNMRVLENNGRLSEALARCVAAVQILDGYDDEGVVSYDCDAIEEAINRRIP
jgi:hypothetical protein